MTMQDLDNYLEKRIESDKDFIRFTFYEIRIKQGLSEEEARNFLSLAKNKLKNIGYNVYVTDEKYEYKDAKMTVQSNELMIATKE